MTIPIQAKPAPSQPGFIPTVTMILVFFLLTRTPQDADMWWHLRAGQEMWEQKTILLTDQFSYTHLGQPWTNAFWLSELVLFGSFKAGGYFGLGLYVSLIGAFTFSWIQRGLPGSPLANAFIVLLGVLTAAPAWGPRPQLISFALIAILQRFLDGPAARRLWALPVLFMAWANLHGGWIWGFLLLFAYLAGDLVERFFEPEPERRRTLDRRILGLAGWTAVSAAAIGVNPNGIGIWRLPFRQVDVSMQIQEWLSPDFHRIDFHPMLWLLFLLIAFAAWSGVRPRGRLLFTALGFAYLTFVAQRNIALFAITAVPLLADWVHAASEKWPRKPTTAIRPLPVALQRAMNATLLLALSAAALGRLHLLTRPALLEANHPAQAVDWIRETRPAGAMFNSYNWGGYLIWSLPEYPVFIDGRADMYGEELIHQWQTVVSADELATSILDGWDVNFLLVEPDWPIVDYLTRQGWVVEYRDPRAVVLVRP